jgi:hypothetical protein
MTTSQPPVESIFVRSWTLLSSNWIIVVPGVVIGLVVGVLKYMLRPPVYVFSAGDTTIVQHQGTGILAGLVIALIGLIGSILTIAYTTGMAGAAWARGVATLEDGAAALRADFSNIVVAIVGLIVLGAVAGILVIPTLGLAIAAYYLFTLYTMPAAIIGARPGIEAIKESFQITIARFVPTLIIAVLLFVVSLVVGIIAAIFGTLPLVGPIVAGIIQGAVVAYATLVIVGEYLVLRQIAPAVAAQESPLI